MASRRSAVQSNSSSDYWPPELSDELGVVDLDQGRGGRPRRRPSFGKRVLRALFTLGLGVGGTLAWQSYGDTAREMIADASPQLSWLAPPAVAAVPAAAETDASASAAAAPAAPASDQQQLNATSLGLAAVRQSIDQLAAQFAAGQQQMANQIARLQSADQDILQKIAAPPQIAAPPPRPAAPPARKPVALTPPPSPPATAAR